MFRRYKMTSLEEFLELTYEEAGIIYPDQITVEELAYRLNVWVHYRPFTSRAMEAVSGKYSMLLDSRIPPDKQRLDFLHELCHLLRHAGNQMSLPESFTRMQEAEAEHFVLYASMPLSMIKRIELPDRRNEAIQSLSHTFGVPLSLAKCRVDQIQRRTLQGALDETAKSYKDQKSNHPCWSPETERILMQLDRQLISKGLPGYTDKGLI